MLYTLPKNIHERETAKVNHEQTKLTCGHNPSSIAGKFKLDSNKITCILKVVRFFITLIMIGRTLRFFTNTNIQVTWCTQGQLYAVLSPIIASSLHCCGDTVQRLTESHKLVDKSPYGLSDRKVKHCITLFGMKNCDVRTKHIFPYIPRRCIPEVTPPTQKCHFFLTFPTQ